MIRNLKIFFDSSKNRRKFKLQLTSLALSLVLTVTGCSFNKDIVSDNSSSTDSISYSDVVDDDSVLDEVVPSNSNVEMSDVSFSIIEDEVLLSDEDNINFQNYIDGIDVAYPMSDYFHVDEFMERYSNLEGYIVNSSNRIIKNNCISFDDLYNQVVKNNKEYLEANSAISSKYEETTDEFVRKICNVIVEYLNDYIDENGDKIDLNSLDIKLSELKVFDSTTFSYAYYNPDTGILGASSNVIDNVKETSQDDLAFEKVIEHETNHIIQACTADEVLGNDDYSMRFGPCYKFSDLVVNCGYWDWYFEGAAESLTSKYNNTNVSLTYPSYIKSIEAIKAATVLKDDISEYTFEELCFQDDLNKIFDYFNCKTDSDKVEIINLMYSFNIINTDSYNSSTNDFYELYKDLNDENMDYTSRRILKSELSSSIGITLSKQFYSNLSNIIVEKNIKVEEVFQLVSVFETTLSRLTRYYSNYDDEYTIKFIQTYSDIQDNFFQLISDRLSYSLDDIKNAYTEYHANYDIDNLNVSYLDSDGNSFYNYINTSTFNFKDASITSYNDYISSNNYTRS